MEKKLKQLFDYQKFARNRRLDAMLAQAQERCAAIEDDHLEWVSAAGNPHPQYTDSIVGPRIYTDSYASSSSIFSKVHGYTDCNVPIPGTAFPLAASDRIGISGVDAEE